MAKATKKPAGKKPAKKSAPKRANGKAAAGVAPKKVQAEVKKTGAKKLRAKRAVVPRLAVPPLDLGASAAVLDRLWDVVMSRRDADPAISHSARLLGRGTAKVAQKFGEEAVECLIEAVAGNHAALIAESADVLYHLLVVWVDAGIRPPEVWAELQRREGVSGIAEKAARPFGLNTTKIP